MSTAKEQFKENGGGPRVVAGLLAEYGNVDELLRAAERVRDAGYAKWDCHSPFPVHGLDRAMGMKYTKLPIFILCCGLTGTATAVVLQWWMNAVDYPYLISGKPIYSFPANVPIIFELTVLFTAFGTLFGLLGFNKLPQWRHFTFTSDRFRRATQDRFFISVEASDPKFDTERTRALLATTGSSAIEELED